MSISQGTASKLWFLLGWEMKPKRRSIRDHCLLSHGHFLLHVPFLHPSVLPLFLPPSIFLSLHLFPSHIPAISLSLISDQCWVGPRLFPVTLDAEHTHFLLFPAAFWHQHMGFQRLALTKINFMKWHAYTHCGCHTEMYCFVIVMWPWACVFSSFEPYYLYLLVGTITPASLWESHWNYFLQSLFYNKHLNHSLYYLCGKCVCFCVDV